MPDDKQTKVEIQPSEVPNDKLPEGSQLGHQKVPKPGNDGDRAAPDGGKP